MSGAPQLALCSGDKSWSVVDAKTGERRLHGEDTHTRAIRCIAWKPDSAQQQQDPEERKRQQQALVERAGGDIAFFKQLLKKSGKRTMRHSVVAVIGNGRVGKTCLIAALQGRPFDAAMRSTEGIDTCQNDAHTWSPGADGEAGTSAAGSVIEAALQKQLEEELRSGGTSSGAEREPEPDEAQGEGGAEKKAQQEAYQREM